MLKLISSYLTVFFISFQAQASDVAWKKVCGKKQVEFIRKLLSLDKITTPSTNKSTAFPIEGGQGTYRSDDGIRTGTCSLNVRQYSHGLVELQGIAIDQKIEYGGLYLRFNQFDMNEDECLRYREISPEVFEVKRKIVSVYRGSLADDGCFICIPARFRDDFSFTFDRNSMSFVNIRMRELRTGWGPLIVFRGEEEIGFCGKK